MRSRYVAFVQSDWDYLNRTQRHQDDIAPVSGIEWTGLEVLACHGGGNNDTEGTVEFVASHIHAGRPGTLHEVSHFLKENGEWFYVSGVFPRSSAQPKHGRNSPCPCGSSKKFKKCCGDNNQGRATATAGLSREA